MIVSSYSGRRWPARADEGCTESQRNRGHVIRAVVSGGPRAWARTGPGTLGPTDSLPWTYATAFRLHLGGRLEEAGALHRRVIELDPRAIMSVFTRTLGKMCRIRISGPLA